MYLCQHHQGLTQQLKKGYFAAQPSNVLIGGEYIIPISGDGEASKGNLSLTKLCQKVNGMRRKKNNEGYGKGSR